LDADEKGESSQYTLFDDPWHAAEAYNLIIVAQTFHIEGNYPKALRAAGTLSLYMDVIDPVQIFSMIGTANLVSRPTLVAFFVFILPGVCFSPYLRQYEKVGHGQ
jgi:hypothetical protein